MEKLFSIVVNMGVIGSAAIVLVLLARLALKKAPKLFSYALWAVVLFRLLCPFTLESPFSLAPDLSAEPLRTNRTIHIYPGDTRTYTFHTPPPDLPGQTALELPEGVSAVPAAYVPDKAPGLRLSVVGGWVWAAGFAALLGYSLFSLLRLRRRLVGSVPLEGEKNVRLADHIPSPFVLGLIRPVIYLPSDLAEGERDYILLHERTHIRRCDHITRALAWLAVALHWFNPLVWLAFHLAGRDMEMSCDEAVLKRTGRDIRADYSSSLLRLSTGGRLPAGPLAFGGSGFQSRIKNILSYKKPALWVTVLALIGVLGLGVAMATDPRQQLIEPDSIVSYTAVNSRSYTLKPDYTGVSTDADRQGDLANPSKQRILRKEDGDELVRLVNLYRKSVYGQGALTLNGHEHDLIRMDRADGSYYLLDFWYWNGFSFHPLHFGEDSYTTLVSYYDSAGNPGITWQMEYNFDRAFQEWRQKASQSAAESPAPDDSGTDLSFTMAQTDTSADPFLRVSGTVYGRELSRAIWSPEGLDALYGAHPGGELSMEYRFEKGGVNLAAWWADEGRKSVTVSTLMSAMLSSYMPSGWWEFTVDLSGEQGRVASMESCGGQKSVPEMEPRMYPEAITEQEAVFLARIAAKTMTASEDFYNNYNGPIPSPPAQAVPSPSLQPSLPPTPSSSPRPSPSPSAQPSPAPSPSPAPEPSPTAAPTPDASWLETGIMTGPLDPAPAPPPGALEGAVLLDWDYFSMNQGTRLGGLFDLQPTNGSHVRVTYANGTGLPVTVMLVWADDPDPWREDAQRMVVPERETGAMVFDIPADRFGNYYVYMEENREGRHLQGYLAVTQF